MKKTSILALDLAKVAGYAWYREGEAKAESGVLDVSKFPDVGTRLASFYKWGLRKTKEWEVTDLVVESPVIGGGKEGKIIWLVSAYGIFMMLGAQCRIDVTKIRNDTFFIHWCGTNNIEGLDRKHYSVLEAQRRGCSLSSGHAIEDHNEADALGVLSLRCRMLNISTPWDSQKSPGPLFTGAHEPKGTKITQSNKRAAAIILNKGQSFNRGE